MMETEKFAIQGVKRIRTDALPRRCVNLYTHSGGQQGRTWKTFWPTSYDPAIPLCVTTLRQTYACAQGGMDDEHVASFEVSQRLK